VVDVEVPGLLRRDAVVRREPVPGDDLAADGSTCAMVRDSAISKCGTKVETAAVPAAPSKPTQSALLIAGGAIAAVAVGLLGLLPGRATVEPETIVRAGGRLRLPIRPGEPVRSTRSMKSSSSRFER
jgi:hypothetical protein